MTTPTAGEVTVSDESDDAVFTDVTKTPAWTSAPETIGLALSDETEDWCFDFHDAQDVSWFSGPNPVDVCVTYVRSDIVAALRARLAAAESRLREYEDGMDMLDMMFTRYENGTPCNEGSEDDLGAYLGMAFRIDDDDFQRIVDLLNKHRPARKEGV